MSPPLGADETRLHPWGGYEVAASVYYTPGKDARWLRPFTTTLGRIRGGCVRLLHPWGGGCEVAAFVYYTPGEGAR
jgi:hypothetical protein